MSNKQIWKFQIQPDDSDNTLHVVVPMPKGAQILSLQMQHGVPCLWTLVDPLAEKENRTFQFYGTGWDIPNNLSSEAFIGTVQIENTLVFHLFEVK